MRLRKTIRGKRASEVWLEAYRNPTGLLAVRIDGEGDLIIPGGKRIPAGHRAWEESDEDIELRDLDSGQARKVKDILEVRAEMERVRLDNLRRKEEEEKAAIEAARLKEEERLRRDKEKAEAYFERRRLKRMRADKIWDKLIASLYKNTETDALDMFVGTWEDPGFRNRPDPDGFITYLDTVSGDVGMSYEYALDSKSEALYDKYVLLLESGFGPDYYSNAPKSMRQLRERMRDIYSGAWYDAAVKDWEKAKKSRRWPEILGQKYIGWREWSSLSPTLKKRALLHLKQGDIEGARMAVGWSP